MSLFLDVILLVVIAISVFGGLRRGFVKSIMSLVSIIAATVCAWIFTPSLAAFYKEHIFLEKFSSSIESALNSLINSGVEKIDISELFADKPEAFLDIADRYNANISSLESFYESQVSSGAENITDNISLHIAEPLAQGISSVLAFFTIFVAVILVLKILTVVLNTVFKLPGLNVLNRVLGLAVGCICGLLYAFILSYIFTAAIPVLSSVFPETISADAASKSILIPLFEKYNIFTLFI